MVTPKHILGTFDEALSALRNNVLMMAGLTERSLERAMKGLFNRDDNLCVTAIADDEELDVAVGKAMRGEEQRPHVGRLPQGKRAAARTDQKRALCQSFTPCIANHG